MALLSDSERSILLYISAGLGGSIALILSFYSPNPYLVNFAVALFVATGLSIFITNSGDIRFVQFSHRNFLILVSLITLLTTIIWVDAGKNRTPTIFLIFGVLYGTIAVASIQGRTKLYLASGLFVGLLQRILAFYSSTLLLGNDVLYHNRQAKLLSDVGTLGIFENKYFYAPVYHTYVSMVQQFLGVDVRTAAFWAVTVLVTIVVTLICFSFVRKITSDQIACIASIFYLGSDGLIQMTTQPQPNTLSISFGVIIFSLSIRYFSLREFRVGALTIGFFIVLSITHQLSTFIVATGVTAIYLGYVLDGVIFDVQ